MASLISSMAKEIFQTLKGSGRVLSLFDEHGNKVFEPEAAISFFAEPDKLMVNISADGADSALNMYISDSADVDNMRKMIDTLRNTATRFNYLFNVRKYGRDLSPKDFAFKATPMMESMWGSAKTSYQNIGKSKIIVKHSTKISEEVRGARSRRIHAIFVETASGERFRCPMNSLHGARAFAKHLDAGGTPHDEFSTYIFAECAMQGEINRVRRHIRRIKEATPDIVSLAETLNTIVGESKARINKSKGNRFYTGIVEQITNAPNHVGPLASEIAEQVEAMSSLLGINETDSLFPILESVAKTILETKQMDPINFEEETMLQTYVFEDDSRVADLIETLIGEFGLEEGVHFERAGLGVSMISESAMDGATMYLQGFDGFKLEETAQDKFTQYATQWLTKRFKDAGMDQREIDQADLPKQATELATGLKQVVAGAHSVKIKGGQMPRFADQSAAIAFKLDKLLAPGSGLGNDALWNFVSTLSDKIGHGDGMDANERFFAQKLADLVDKAAVAENTILPEMSALEEWMGQFDEARGPNPYEMGDDEIHDRGPDLSEIGMEKELEGFDFSHYMREYGSDYEGFASGEYKNLDTDDRTYSRNYIKDSVTSYIARLINVDSDAIASWEYGIDALVDEEVVPSLERLGFIVGGIDEEFDMSVFEDDIDEALGNSGSEFSPAFVDELRNQIKKLDSGDYYGIISGDDADDDAMNLVHAIIRNLGNDLQSDLMDSWEKVADIAREVWSQDESIEEAGNYPDDYNASRDPNAMSDPSDAIGSEFYEEMEEIVHNPPKDSTLSKVTASWFDGEADEDLLEDLAGDVVGYTMKLIDRRNDEELGSYYYEDNKEEVTAKAKELLRAKFLSGVSEAVNDVKDATRMSLMQLKDTINSFIKQNPNGSVDDVFSAMQEYYMDSRTMGPLLYKHDTEIKAAISDKLQGLEETIGGADQGDDFVQDITYHSDGNEELEHIARLRKLAGL